ncbi:TPA: DUF3150 domain-containing protein [Photobacterium damselae]
MANLNKGVKSIEIIKKTALITLRFAKTSGRKKLQPNDLGLSESQLPPDQIASLGSKTTINPKSLNVFDKLKRRADRYCETIGVKLSAQTYAIPESKIVEVCTCLDSITNDYRAAVSDFVKHYDLMIDEWVSEITKENPAWGERIKNAASTSEMIKNKFYADYDIYQLNTEINTDAQALTLSKQGSSIATGLQKSVYSAIDEFMNNLTTGKVRSSSAISTLEKIKDKVDSMAFINTKYLKVAQVIDSAKNTLPATGYLNSDDIVKVSGILHVINTPDLLKAVTADNENVEINSTPVNNQANEINQQQIETTVVSTEDKTIVHTDDISMDCSFDFGNDDQIENQTDITNQQSEEQIDETQSEEEPKPLSSFTFFY